jgi:hypothetical protein
MRKGPENLKRTLLFIIAGVAAVKIAQEIPAMVRYYKMTRL